MRILLLAPLALLAAALPAQNAADPCAVASDCRHVGTVHIERPDGRGENVKVDETMPWVTQDNVMLFPGESVTVRLEMRDGERVPRLVRAGAVSAGTAPSNGEIRFTLGGFSKGNLILTVENSGKEALDYAALMVTPDGPARTSVCTLRPGIPVYESWSAPIVQLALWHFVPATETGCKTLKWGTEAA